MSLTKVSNSMITGAVVNVLDYGADRTGVTDSTTAVQNAVNAIKNIGGSVYFPRGTYKCNILADGTAAINLLGDGIDCTTILSFSNNQFAVFFNNNFRYCSVQNITFSGSSKNTHGVYVNIGSHFSVNNCKFQDCGMGLVFNATIDNQINNSVFRACYVGVYFTCRTTAGNPTITDINGQSFTFTNAFFPSYAGATEFAKCSFEINNIGCAVDQKNNPFSTSEGINLTFYMGVVEGNSCGFLYINIGASNAGNANILHHGVWFENNPGTAVVFDGVTYSNTGAIYQANGRVNLDNVRTDRFYVDNTALLAITNSTLNEGTIFNKAANASILLADNSHDVSNFSIYTERSYMRLNRNRGILTKGTSGYSYKYANRTKYSNKLLNADTLSFFGAGSSANVADGVLDVNECKAATITTAGNGPVLFDTSGGVTLDKIYVGIISLKWVSGETTLSMTNTGAGAAFGSFTLPLTSNWKTFMFYNQAISTSASGTVNFLTIASASTVVRISGACLVEFDNLQDAMEFIDSNNFAVV